MITVAFTGHRPDKLGGYGANNPLRDTVMQEIEDTLICWNKMAPLTCISGMAVGLDQWAAIICVRLRIPFIAAVPFHGQESQWPVGTQLQYRKLLQAAERVEVISTGDYASSKMQKRNEWMVDNSDRLLAVWDGSSGGTSNCIGYARAKRKPISMLNIKDGKVIGWTGEC